MAKQIIPFDFTLLSRMSLVANFVVGTKQVMFMYYSSNDTCYVLVDQEPVGYFSGDSIFHNNENKLIARVKVPVKSTYSFEKESIPTYVATVTEYLLLNSV